VVIMTNQPEVALRKMHNTTAHHSVQDAVGSRIISITKESLGRNLTEVLANPLQWI
jgi:hypothetical protein